MTKQRTRKAPNDIIAPGGITVREAGRKGGQSTLERRGVEFFREIGHKGGQRTKKLYGDLFSELGRRGGRPRRPNLENSSGEEFPEKREADAVGPRDSPPA